MNAGLSEETISQLEETPGPQMAQGIIVVRVWPI